MTRRLTLQEISAEAFAPFGQLLPPLKPGPDQFQLLDELQNRRGAAKLRLAISAIAPTPLPLQATQMERHVYSTQAFIPMEAAAYLILVAPHGADGLPDAAGLCAFRVPGDTGINYNADIWHHPITALERDARFAVLTFVDGSVDDQQFVSLPEMVLIE